MELPVLALDDLARLHELGLQMARSRSVTELCRLALEALRRVLPDRGIHVQIWSRMAPHGSWSSSGGPEMSADLVREPLVHGPDRLGEIVVDSRDRRGCAMGEHEHAAIGAVAELVSAFAARELEHEVLLAEKRALASFVERLAEEEDALEAVRTERARRMRAVLEQPLATR